MSNCAEARRTTAPEKFDHMGSEMTIQQNQQDSQLSTTPVKAVLRISVPYQSSQSVYLRCTAYRWTPDGLYKASPPLARIQRMITHSSCVVSSMTAAVRVPVRNFAVSLFELHSLYRKIDDELVMDVDDFSDVKPVIISSVIVLNVIMNSLVIAAIARYPALREDRTALFMFTLCVSDLAGGCTAMPISAALCSRATPNVRTYLAYLPKIQMLCYWCCGFNSMHSIAWVALSKMVAIATPFRYEQLLTRNRCYGIIVFNWVVGAALAAVKLPIYTSWNTVTCTFRSPANNKQASRLIFSTYILAAAVPTLILIIATSVMFVVVLRTHKLINTQVQSIGGSSGGAVSAGLVTVQTIRSAKNILIICFVSVALIIPVLTFAVIRHAINNQRITDAFSFSAMWIYN